MSPRHTSVASLRLIFGRVRLGLVVIAALATLPVVPHGETFASPSAAPARHHVVTSSNALVTAVEVVEVKVSAVAKDDEFAAHARHSWSIAAVLGVALAVDASRRRKSVVVRASCNDATDHFAIRRRGPPALI
ncbi:MAG: hypothetical protein JWL83_3323 [Actinomycetia bacterium]|nr:hypothetical protein [Actinomycetes bacterium]